MLTVAGRSGGTGLEAALADLKRRFGPGAVRSGEPDHQAWLDSEVPGLTLPRGRLSCLGGGPGSGSAELGLVLLAAVSRRAAAVLVDFTGAADPAVLVDYGGDLSQIWVVRPRRPLEGWAAARALARAGAALCLLLPSDPMPPATGATAVGLHNAAAGSGSAILLAGGGRPAPALRERIFLDFDCRRLRWVTSHDDISGMQVELRLSRSRLGPPGESWRLQINFPRPYPQVAGATLQSEPVADPESWRAVAG